MARFHDARLRFGDPDDEHEVLSPPCPSKRFASGTPVASSDSRPGSNPIRLRVGGRRDRFRGPPREKAARFPDPRCLGRQVIGAPRARGVRVSRSIPTDPSVFT
jgi:hypothetical protein